jgi:hypothetical protein
VRSVLASALFGAFAGIAVVALVRIGYAEAGQSLWEAVSRPRARSGNSLIGLYAVSALVGAVLWLVGTFCEGLGTRIVNGILERIKGLTRADVRQIEDAVTYLNWPADPIGKQRETMELVVAAEDAVEMITTHPAWHSPLFDEYRAEFDLKEELLQIAVAGHRLISVHDKAPTEPVDDGSPREAQARARWNDRTRLMEDGFRALSERVSALQRFADAFPDPVVTNTNLRAAKEAAVVEGDLMWVATAGESCVARARLVDAAAVRLATRPAPVTDTGGSVG